jgi:soluble cytochrome b562
MTRDELFAFHDQCAARAKALMEKKNKDYAKESDPLRNFRRHGLKGFVVRMDDKMARLDNFVENGTLAVSDESVEDSLIDLLNYSVLMLAMLQEQRSAPPTITTSGGGVTGSCIGYLSVGGGEPVHQFTRLINVTPTWPPRETP